MYNFIIHAMLLNNWHTLKLALFLLFLLIFVGFCFLLGTDNNDKSDNILKIDNINEYNNEISAKG